MDDCLTLTKFNMLYQVSLSIQYHSLQFVLEADNRDQEIEQRRPHQLYLFER